MDDIEKKELVIIIKQLFQFIFCLLLVFSLGFAKGAFNTLESIAYARQRLSYRFINHPFFCPEDNIKKLLIGLINAETLSINAALFQITDEDIAHALIDAKKRGVRIEIIVDQHATSEKHSKVQLLRRNRIPVYQYRKGFYSLMHNKFFIFRRTIFSKALVWTGSANATTGGTVRNQENVFITQSPDVIKRYYEKFNMLKQNTVNTNKMQEDQHSAEHFASLLQFLLSWFPGY